MLITPKMISHDIASLRGRIATAKAGLAKLTEGRLDYSDHRKREAKRRQLETEIGHCRRLISIIEQETGGSNGWRPERAQDMRTLDEKATGP